MATAPQQVANPYDDPQTAAVYDQMRQTVSPKEFGDEVLAGASQVDPQAVAQFRDDLSQINLPPEALDLLNNMVDEILANPQQYAEVRAKYLEMGAPEELLPEQFDPGFFAAMNMAVDQMVGAPSGEQAFAKGGIAELKPVSKAIADYGRNGDTMLAHITPAEARMLRRKGGSGTINPKTGLPEYFNLFKSIGKAFKAVGNAVKSFASSTVGKIVTTVALGFFLGPAAASFMGVTSAAGVAAVSGFVGSAGATLAGGGNLSQALKAGAIGGLTAGAVSGVTGGFSTDYAGPTTVGGQFDKFTNAITPSSAPAGNVAPPASVPAIETPSLSSTGQASGQVPVETRTIGPANWSDETWANQPAVAKPVASPAFMETPSGAAEQVFKAPGSVAPPTNPFAPTPTNYGAFGEAPINASQTTAAAGNAIAPPIGANPMDATQFEGSLAKMAPGSEPSFFDKAKTFINENISPSGIQQQGMPAAQDAGAKAVTDLVARMPDATPAMKEAAYQKALNAASPGIFATYGPATALGIGAIGAFGGFSPKTAPISPYQDMLTGGPGSARDLLNKNPNRFYIQGLPGVQYYNGSVMKPPGMATGGEVQHFAGGGVSDADVAQWWKDNSNKGYSDAYIADLMDQFSVTPEQFSRAIGANQETAADIASRYTAVPETKTITDSSGYDTQTINLTRQSDGTYLGNNGQTYDASGTPIVAPPVVTTDTGGGGNDTTVTGGSGNDTVVTSGGNNTVTTSGGGNNTTTRSAADQAIWNYFLTPGLTDTQIVAAMKANNWNINDIARVTGTTANLDDFNRRIAAVNTATTTTPPITTTTPPVTTTGTGSSTPLTAAWFINPQTAAQGTKGVTVPSNTLRGNTLPTDALSRIIQGDLQAAGPTVSDATMQQWMDKRGWDPRQVAYAINTGVPEVQSRYYGAKNAGILGAQAPAMNTPQPYNTTAGITQLMSPTGPLGEFSTRTATPVAPAASAAPTGGITSLMPAAATPGSQNLPVLPQNTVANDQLAAQAARAQKDYLFAMNDKKAAFMNMGGIAGLAQGGYPRKTGQIDGPGTATSDSIPAMLSDGEFVMTAKAVRGAGKGDRRAGAKRMYALMHQLEQNAARG